MELAAPDEATPLLHRARITLDPSGARELLEAVAADTGEDGLIEIDPLALIEASATQREVEVDALASVARIEPSALMAIGQVLARPLLLAVGERARGRTPAPWERGYCPVCAAWPLLSELRGIDRERMLRCGRCTAEWKFRHVACPYCGNDDHRSLKHLAVEELRESRRITVCDRCHGGLKGIATLTPLDPEDLALTDLATIDLDLAALERGYGRPTAPAFALDLSVEPA